MASHTALAFAARRAFAAVRTRAVVLLLALACLVAVGVGAATAFHRTAAPGHAARIADGHSDGGSPNGQNQ